MSENIPPDEPRKKAIVTGAFQPAPAVSSAIDQWRRPLDTMVNGAVRMTRVAVPLMTCGGRVIHVTSIHGERAAQSKRRPTSGR